MEMSGYEILDQLNEGKYFSTYRALRDSDQKRVILKTSRFDLPTAQALTTLQHEYQLLQQVNSPKVVKAYDLIKHQQQLVLVLDDFEGQTLKSLLAERTISISEFFVFAIQLVEALEHLHQKNIIHKDINPLNIIVKPASLQLQLIDFSIASKYSQESATLIPEHLEGTLAYLSPEQTGRMNCLVDYRSDFYSLGMTFYEMLTGTLPFATDDPLELIYNHLTQHPKSVSEIKSSIPLMIAGIIAKLTAKLPDERYASAAGLKTDLILCQQQWEKNQKILSFPLGKNDFSGRLNISQKLYGREDAIQQLLNLFSKAHQGQAQWVMVSGYSGIGKTSVIRETYKPITKYKGYFINGKFDQLKNNMPYSALIEAFELLVNRWFSLSAVQLSELKTVIENNLGPNSRVISDVIPALASIIGEQPALPELPAEQARRRFALTFENFVRTLATSTHPLVLFLDDLQWADAASLQLLAQLAADRNLQNFFFIGAYRDNEVDLDHPLAMTLQSLENAGVNIERIILAPLSLVNVTEMLADTFLLPSIQVRSLAELILAKTQGNPFFINEFIKTLYQQGLLNSSKGKWQWDMEQIKAQKITDNIVDLLSLRLQSLPVDTQKIIASAACLGHSFDLKMLATISDQSIHSTAQQLWILVENNFIKPIGSDYMNAEILATDPTFLLDNITIHYQFVHDRLQQTADLLLSPAEKIQIHLKSGKLLLAHENLDSNHAKLFEIMNHFDQCLDFIVDPAQQDQLALYNLWAGQKAKASNAYQAAIEYLHAGLVLMTNKSWNDRYSLLFDLNIEYAECHYITGDFAKADAVITQLYTKAHSQADKFRVYSINIYMLNSQGRLDKALSLGLHALKEVGISIPKAAKIPHVLFAMLQVSWLTLGKNIETLELSPLQSADLIAVDKLMAQLMNIAFLLNQNTFVVILNKVLYLNLKYGYTENFPFIAALNAHICINALNKYELGFAYNSLSQRIAATLPMGNAVTSQRFIQANFINYNKHPLAQSLPELNDCYKNFLEIGNLVYAFYSLGEYDLILLVLGKPLSEVHNRLLNQISFTSKHHITEFEVFNATLRAVENNTEKGQSYYYYALLSYLSGNYTQALHACEANESSLQNLLGMPIYSQIQFLHALSIAGCLRQDVGSNKVRYWKKLNSLHKQIKRWAKWSPTNFTHYDFLIGAEISRLNHQNEKAADLYDAAIQAAYDNDYLTVLGIANECAGQFYLYCKKPHFAKNYIRAAHYAFSNWGAKAKCALMQQQYKNLLSKNLVNPVAQMQTLSMDFLQTSTTTSLQSIDLLSILKSNQAVSSEIQIDKLLQKLLAILVENAGAERGLLLMKESNQWVAKAEQLFSDKITTTEPILSKRNDLPTSIIQYAQRSQQQLLLQTPQDFEKFMTEIYLDQFKPTSILIIPIFYKNDLSCLIYLENRKIRCTFSSEQLQTLQMLASQAAISVENAQLYYQATHDNLTGLANRNLLTHLYPSAFSQALQARKHVAILFFDIDNFKSTNDTLGHEAGDQLLLHFTDQLKSLTGKNDLAVRLGGDEFVVMMRNVTSLTEPTKFATQFLQAIKMPFVMAGQAVKISASIGIAISVENTPDIHALLRQADAALYKVKVEGKNNFAIFSE